MSDPEKLSEGPEQVEGVGDAIRNLPDEDNQINSFSNLSKSSIHNFSLVID